MSELPEKLLATVQELRSYLQAFPAAQDSFEGVRHNWLGSQLFPPDDRQLQQALNVLINAGELQVVNHAGSASFRAINHQSPVTGDAG